MERLDGSTLVMPSSVGNLSQDEAGSRNFSEPAQISVFLYFSILGNKRLENLKLNIDAIFEKCRLFFSPLSFPVLFCHSFSSFSMGGNKPHLNV